MAENRIRHPDGPSHRPLTPMYLHSKRHRFMLRKNLRYKLVVLLSHFGAGNYGDWQRFPLPDAFFPLYFLIRPFTWVFRWYIPNTTVYREGPMGRG